MLVCLFCGMLLKPEVWTHMHEHMHARTKSPAAFVHNSSLYVLHCCCRTTRPLQIHTHPQTRCLYVSECVRLISCSTLHQGTQLLCLWVTHYHSVITAATGGLFSENPHFLTASANWHHLLLSCSTSSPHRSLLPAPQFSGPGRADVRVLRAACQ